MAWITVLEYADEIGISRQAAMKRIKAGKVTAELQEDPRQPRGRWMVKSDATDATKSDATDATDATKSDATDATDATKSDATDATDATKSDAKESDAKESDAKEIELFDNIEQLPSVVDDTIPDLRPREPEIPLHLEDLVNARMQVVLMSIEMGIKNFYPAFKMGLVCEDALSVIGKLPSERTIYRWMAAYKRGGIFELCPQYHSGLRGRKVPEAAQNMLLKILLHPNQVHIATAVDYVRDHYRVKGMKLDCSYRTVVRWVNDWKDQHPEEWTIARNGVKHYREKMNRTVLRDWTMVAVGDVWVSDGHVLELMIIDPRDGKPKKHELVVWFDAGSRMPMGGALNITENTEVIQLSFRNAALFAGYLPQVVYTDNGKAYKSKYMLGASADAIEAEMQGLFARLGVATIHSIPYNAKAKLIERWWLDVQDQVERVLPAFTGPHNQAKPANLHRNEKFIQKRFPHEAITIEQFKAIFEYWAIEIYGRKPHPDYPNKTRMQVFQEGSELIPEERRITPEQLNFMLLAIEKKRVRNQGITLNKTIYWSEELVRHVGKDVIVRWDFWDVRSILVYSADDQFICQAPVRELQDPLVKLREGTQSHRALAADLAEIKRVERRAIESTGELLELVSGATTDLTHKLTAQEIGIIDDTPLMPELPAREQTIDEKIAALELPHKEPEDDNDGFSAERLEQLRAMGLDV